MQLSFLFCVIIKIFATKWLDGNLLLEEFRAYAVSI